MKMGGRENGMIIKYSMNDLSANGNILLDQDHILVLILYHSLARCHHWKETILKIPITFYNFV
jgi:hypothetical protein